MKSVVIYIHGKGGNAANSVYYEKFFKNIPVLGFDYKAQNPMEAYEEFNTYFNNIYKTYDSIYIIAESIGAYFLMSSITSKKIIKAFFISPLVDMEELIFKMMDYANVSLEELKEKQIIPISFGEPLSYPYLKYVQTHPLNWHNETYILYGDHDNLTSYKTIKKFSKDIKATLTVMKDGEHYFHTLSEMTFLDNWLKKSIKIK
jgi:hypothetical protein